MPHGMMFCGAAVEYSARKLNFDPLQVNGSVFWNPFALEAIMNPVWPVVQSVSFASSALPPGIVASNNCTVILSPGFINSVWEFGVNVALSLSCGLGGPVGTPLRWTQ